MSLYEVYLNDIAEREKIGLNPKPIDNGDLIDEIITNILEKKNSHRKKSLQFLIYNTVPGTTGAALSKAYFLKDIILGKFKVEEISQLFAFKLLSHMKGGPSVKVLIDLALSNNSDIVNKAIHILKQQVFLYDSDIERLKLAYTKGNGRKRYSKAILSQFFKLPKLKVK